MDEKNLENAKQVIADAVTICRDSENDQLAVFAAGVAFGLQGSALAEQLKA